MARPNLVTRLHLLFAGAQAPFLAIAFIKVPAGTELALHWTEQGATDWAWTAPLAFLVMPAIAAILLAVAAASSARADSFRLETVRHLLDPGLSGLLLILLALETGLLLMGLGSDIDLIRIVVPAVGAGLVFLGILLREAERHTYAGLRLPWAIEDDAAWRRAHLAAGWAGMAMGVLLILLGWLVPYPGVLIGVLAPAIALPLLVGRVASFGR